MRRHHKHKRAIAKLAIQDCIHAIIAYVRIEENRTFPSTAGIGQIFDPNPTWGCDPRWARMRIAGPAKSSMTETEMAANWDPIRALGIYYFS